MKTNFYTPQPLRYNGVQQAKSRTAVPQQPQFSAANIDITEQDFKPLFSTGVSKNDRVGKVVQARLAALFRNYIELKETCEQANGAVHITLDRVPEKVNQHNPTTDLFRIAVGKPGVLNLFKREELITFSWKTLREQGQEIASRLISQITAASLRLEKEQQATLEDFYKIQDKK